MAQQDFDEAIKQYNMAMSDFFKGNPEPINNFYSRCNEISLAQLSGPFVLGRKNVTATASCNAMKYREGADTTFETLAKYVTPEFAYTVNVERTRPRLAEARKIFLWL